MSARFELLSFLAAIVMGWLAIHSVVSHVRGNGQSIALTTITTSFFAILSLSFFRASIGIGNLQKRRQDLIERAKNNHEHAG
jgi:hypothetical protein